MRLASFGTPSFWIPATGLALVSALIFSCGKSDDDKDSAPLRKKFSQTYNAGLSAGDTMVATVNTDALTYSVKGIEGMFAGQREEGSLKPLAAFNNDAYEASGSGATVIPIQDEVVLGKFDNHFFVGVPELTDKVQVTTWTGVYNYVRYSTRGIHTTGYGSVQFFPDLTFKAIEKENLSEKTTGTIMKGTYKDNGKGVLALYVDGNAQKLANVMMKPDGNGKHFAVVDFIMSPLSGIGFAQKQVLEHPDLNGTYNALIASEDESVTGVIKGKELTVTLGDGTKVQLTLQMNAPWDGIISATGKLPDDGMERNRRLHFSGIYSASGNIYAVMEFFKNNNELSLQPATAFVAIKK